MARARQPHLKFLLIDFYFKHIAPSRKPISRSSESYPRINQVVDKNPEFLFVAKEKVMEVAKSENAIPFDAPGAEVLSPILGLIKLSLKF